ncbi:MAG TPA: nucleoside hydrolase-like domain-containing protein, partial [Caulifigura sp.]|nr:nucleoside hydrolase-like domain-containing protein [Caulifigura sp.]
MRRCRPLLLLFLLLVTAPRAAADRPRLAILTDIGGDPDDTQSLIRLLHYANEFEIEVLLTSAAGVPGELKESITRPDLVLKVIGAYEAVLPNFRKHAQGWPEPGRLRDYVVSGNPHRGREHIGEGHDTDGSRRLVQRIDSG